MAEMEVSKGTGTTALDVKAMVEARVKAAIEEGATRPEIAEPEGWWNLWALGPFQVTGVGGPLLPHKVIREGETFYVATVIWLSPTFILPAGPGISVCQFISSLACYFEIDYCTNDMCALQSEPLFSPQDIKIDTVADQCFYVDVQQFTAEPGTESCIYEMNICARMLGCEGALVPLAGFVTEVYDFDVDLFYPPVAPPPPAPFPSPVPSAPPGAAPGWRFNQPLRFQIYK
jgi:hypothetical protein